MKSIKVDNNNTGQLYKPDVDKLVGSILEDSL